MAQACNNIGKELSSITKESSTSLAKPVKLSALNDGRKSLKRSAPTDSTSNSASKRTFHSNLSNSLNNGTLPSYYSSPNPYLFDALFHHLNKTLSSSITDYPFLSMGSFLQPSIPSSPSSFPTSFWINSLLSSTEDSSSLVCNWIDSNLSDGYCGQRFTNQYNLLEHLCAAHTSSLSSSTILNSFEKRQVWLTVFQRMNRLSF